jgi:hypothetical protein
MAQTGYTPIQLYYSSTTTNVPLAANLASGELAINITDGKLFYKDNANAVQVIGWKVRPATAGGTGLTSFAVGDLIYANTTTTLASLADVATGNALISGGVSTAPSWGKIGLTTHVSGTLPIANGGTNQTAFTAKSGNVAGLVYFDGTSLANNSTVTRIGYDTTLNQLLANSILSSQIFTTAQAASAATNGGNLYIYQSGGLASTGGVEWQYATAGSGYGFKQAVNGGTDTWDVGYRANSATWTRAFAVGNNGNATIDNGNLVIGTSGKGIDFSATAGSGTSELLADYEEGTFTPTAGIALSSATGKYTKVGRAVHFEMEVTFPVTISTGGARLTGLPFTPSADNFPCAVWTDKGVAIFAYVEASNTRVNLYNVTTGGIYDYIDFSAKQVKICGTYFV